MAHLLESFPGICRSCHARLGQCTSEDKDITSDSRKGLQKFKQRLDFQHCPRYSMTMEKTESYNNITCCGMPSVYVLGLINDLQVTYSCC